MNFVLSRVKTSQTGVAPQPAPPAGQSVPSYPAPSNAQQTPPPSSLSYLDQFGQQVPPSSLQRGDVAVLVTGPIRAHAVIIDEIRPNGAVYGWRGYGRNPASLEEAIRASEEQFRKWTILPSDRAFKPQRIVHIGDVIRAYRLGNLAHLFPSEAGGKAENIPPGFPPPSRPPVEPSNPEVAKALKEGRYLHFSYVNLKGKPSTRSVEPLYAFMSKAGNEVLLSLELAFNRFRAFRIANMSNVKTGEKYSYDPEERLKQVNRTLVRMQKEDKTDSLIYDGLLGYRKVLRDVIRKRKEKKRKRSDVRRKEEKLVEEEKN